MNTHGFTLIEVLTVVIILGILTAVAMPQYRRAIQKSQATEAVAMLRVILDSSDRLATEYGFRSFQAFATNRPTVAVFSRLDMFNEDTVPCQFSGTQLVCENFTYNLPNAGYVSAVKNANPFSGTELRLSRADVPELTCLNNQTACDLYNVRYVASN